MPTRMPDEMFMMMCHDRLRVETKKFIWNLSDPKYVFLFSMF